MPAYRQYMRYMTYIGIIILINHEVRHHSFIQINLFHSSYRDTYNKENNVIYCLATYYTNMAPYLLQNLHNQLTTKRII